MNGKKVFNFLILKPVFNKTNFSTIFYVALFFAAYVLFGGKMAPMPKIDDSGTFGGVGAIKSETENKGIEKKEVNKYLGLVETEDKKLREEARVKKGLIFNAEEDDLDDPLNKKDYEVEQEDLASRREIRIRKIEAEGHKEASMEDLHERLKKAREYK